MSRPFSVLTAQMSPQRRAKVERRVTATLEKMALHELRRARKLSQTQVAAGLSASQSEISKIENRTDMHVSTLQEYVQALGGHLEIRAVFPDVIVSLELTREN